MYDQQMLRPDCAYMQSDQSVCLTLEYSMSVKLLKEHHLEFLCLKGGRTGASKTALVKMPHCRGIFISRDMGQYMRFLYLLHMRKCHAQIQKVLSEGVQL